MKKKMEQQLALIAKPEDDPKQELKSWALVELFGHQRIVGYLSQQSFGSGVLFRVDVPDLLKDGKVERAGFTRYFGIAAIYSVTPIDEAAVRAMLPHIDGKPSRPMTFSRGDDWQ